MKRIGIIFILLVSQSFAQSLTYRWSLDEVFRLGGAIKTLGATKWMNDGDRFTLLETDPETHQRNMYAVQASTGKRERIMDGSKLVAKSGDKPMRIGSYEWSADGENILITGTLTSRGTKTGGSFGIYNIKSNTFRVLNDAKEEQAIIKFSPDGKKIGFVRHNDLFVMDVATSKETQLTFDGSENILNGKFDWVYEEEFSIIDGWQWSPDSKRIAFWRLDQSAVPTFPLVRYSEDNANAEVEITRYPKPGEHNSTVQIGVATLSDQSVRWLDLGTDPDIYVPRITWTNDPNVLAVQRLNRGQDTLELLLANVASGAMKTILRETDDAWLEVERDDLKFLKDGKHFLWVSWRDGFTHVYLYTLDGTLERQVTRGEWDVTEVSGVDEARKTIYFIAARESPMERHLYSVKFDGSGLKRLSEQPGWHTARFSPDARFFIHSYSSMNSPSKSWLRRADGKLVQTLVENTLDGWKEMPVTQNSFFSFMTPDSVVLNGSMLKPAGFDPSKKYPVLMFVYGAGSQVAINRWGGRNYLWYQLLAERGYIIVSVDPRGTDARGKKFRQTTDKELGYKNTQDLMEASKYLGRLPFVDASRIGIWGWSGGGYHTLMAMTMGAGCFKTGIAVAAVTDFKYYDSIWAERYMETPQRNPEGYKKVSVMTYADKLQGNLLIVHGTTDDNVHWQHIHVLIDELIKNGKQFETMFYPGRAHGISDMAAQKHLYAKMTSFILEKL